MLYFNCLKYDERIQEVLLSSLGDHSSDTYELFHTTSCFSLMSSCDSEFTHYVITVETHISGINRLTNLEVITDGN